MEGTIPTNDNNGSTHSVVCEICGTTVHENHNFDSGDCVCGEKKKEPVTLTYNYVQSSHKDEMTLTSNNVSVQLTFGAGTYSRTPYANKSTYLTFYSGNEVTINAGSKHIKSVTFSFTSGYDKTMEPDSGSYDKSSHKWTPASDKDVTSVTLSNSDSAQARITSIVIVVE